MSVRLKQQLINLFFCVWGGLLCFLSFGSSALQAAEPTASIVVLPSKITLQGPTARHQLLVQNKSGGELNQQLTKNVKFRSENEQVAFVEAGKVIPVNDGQTTIHVETVDPQTQTVLRSSLQVTVTEAKQERPIFFERHVQPVLTKARCNSGACHGALAGKGGFRLSLRGYDSTTDFHTITKQARGRRVELADPGRSLLIAKPTGGIPHKGGLRFQTDSDEYRILSNWISHGATYSPELEAKLERLEILPKFVTLKKGTEQQLLVRAYYDDGTVDDVTQWTRFVSSNEAVARVNEEGTVEVVGAGEGAVTAFFGSELSIGRITSPYENEVPSELFANATKQNFIDELVIKQLKRLNIPPSGTTTDNTFIRRVFVDTIGKLPTAEETQFFLDDPRPDKRNRLIDSLLARPEFVDYWTYKWSDILLLNGTKLRPKAIKAYYDWLRNHVEKNTPWDQFVQEILTAQGSSVVNGATNFYALHQEPELMAENASQAFLSLSIGCAKCHNHPLEKWTNDQYYAMANLFSRVRAKGWGGDGRNGDGVRTLYVASKGELIQPLTGKPQPPTPLDGTPLEFDDPNDRRIHLAKWLTAKENPYFSRAITNRIWANFMGVGLVEQIDDMRVSNPASNEELLQSLSDYLISKQFDVKELMRVILKSATYQRSSEPLPGNKEEKRFYSRYYPRRMMAEVLLDAISDITEVSNTFDELELPGADQRKTEFYSEGTRALQLYDSAVKSYFLKTFGRNERLITCECERSDEPTMVQVLHLSNGDTINKKLQHETSRVQKIMSSDLSNEQIIEQAFLRALSRYPKESEKEKLLGFLNDAPKEERRLTIEDLYWSLMTSREFLFNH